MASSKTFHLPSLIPLSEKCILLSNKLGDSTGILQTVRNLRPLTKNLSLQKIKKKS